MLLTQENFIVDNPNYVELEVKQFIGAIYYNNTNLGVWDFDPATISLRDDKVDSDRNSTSR